MTIAARTAIHRLPETWTRTIRIGALGALGQVFISLSGMPVRLDTREIVVPVLSLGYVVVLAVPMVVGVLVGNEQPQVPDLSDDSFDDVDRPETEGRSPAHTGLVYPVMPAKVHTPGQTKTKVKLAQHYGEPRVVPNDCIEGGAEWEGGDSGGIVRRGRRLIR